MSRKHEADTDERDDIGRAAQRFARRVARDASRFAEQIADHAGEFGHTLSREWRRRRSGALGDDDLRGVLHDVRAFLADVIDGVDELVEGLFGGRRPAEEPGAEPWMRVVTSRDVACGGCGRAIPAGDECHVRRLPEGRAFRCLDCGPAAADARAGGA